MNIGSVPHRRASERLIATLGYMQRLNGWEGRVGARRVNLHVPSCMEQLLLRQAITVEALGNT